MGRADTVISQTYNSHNFHPRIDRASRRGGEKEGMGKRRAERPNGGTGSARESERGRDTVRGQKVGKAMGGGSRRTSKRGPSTFIEVSSLGAGDTAPAIS
jgi:hypothetical protein